MKSTLQHVDAVLFDLDGTLVDTNIDFPLMKREMLALSAEYGLDIEQLRQLDILAVVDAACALLKTPLAHELRARAMERLEEIEMRHAAGTRAVPFAQELVGDLRSYQVPVGIVTRNCRRASELSLSIAEIVPDVIVTRDDCENHKPHPRPLIMALEILSAKPAASVMVGDHTMDIEGGKNAGMRTIGFLREDRPSDFFATASPDAVAHSLKEIMDAIVHRYS